MQSLFRVASVLAFFGILIGSVGLATADDIDVSYRLTSTSIMSMDTPFAEKYGLSGAADVAEFGITPFVTLLSRTNDVVAIRVVSSGGGMYRTVVREDAPYQSMDDLKGKRIAIRLGSGNYSAFLIYIESRGWSESDFQLVDNGDQEAIAALTAGSVDAVIYWEPIVSILVSRGIARPIFSFDGWSKTLSSSSRIERPSPKSLKLSPNSSPRSSTLPAKLSCSIA